MKIDYQILEKKIKIKLKNKDLLIKSLTHKSFNKENNNEKPVEPTLDTQNLTPLQRLAAKFR